MASETKHTKGPWAATTRKGSWDWLVYSEADPNIEICQMFHDNTEFNEVGEANSRLVAAAPDMLTALMNVVTRLGRRGFESPENPDALLPADDQTMEISDAMRAIAKATS